MYLDDQHVDLEQLNHALRDLRERGMSNLRNDGYSNSNQVDCQYTLEVRYLGQIHEF